MQQKEGREKCKQSAICLYDDVIRYSERAREICQNWLPVILENCLSKDFSTVQAATYGLGVSAEVLPAFSHYLVNSIQILVNIIVNFNRKKKKEGKIVENSISALAKIVLFHHTILNNAQQTFNYEGLKIATITDFKALMNFWLATLPVSLDQLECVVIYSQLCRFITM